MQQLPELDESAFKELREHLAKTSIPMNRYRKGVGDGRSQTFGIVRKRSMAPDLSRNSWLDPRLHYLLMKFAALHVPVPFTSIQVNDSYPCSPHKDKHNEGMSYIVAFGNYTGGELVLKMPNDTEFSIWHRPMLFNGSEIEHWTKPFQGRRWSIVFFTTLSPPRHPMVRKLSDYEPVVVDGSWVIAFRKEDGSTHYLSKKNGLPHPLKGRKKKPEAHLGETYDPRLNDAQNLMLRFREPGT